MAHQSSSRLPGYKVWGFYPRSADKSNGFNLDKVFSVPEDRAVRILLILLAAALLLAPAKRTGAQTIQPAPRPPVSTDLLAQEAEFYLVKFAESGDVARLHNAGKALDILLEEQPSLTYARLLAAFVHRLQGRPEAERETLSRLRPENRAAYAYFFTRPVQQAIAALRCNYVNSCLRSRSPGQEAFLDPFHLVKKARETLRCGGLPLDPASCPEDWEILGRISWSALGENRIAGWLPSGEDLSLEEYFARIGLREGMSVADIGAGTGYFSFPMSRVVGPKGKVYATEIDKQLTDFLAFIAKQVPAENVEVVLAAPDELGLAEKLVDIVFVCEVLQAIVEAPVSPDGGALEVDLRRFLGNCYRALKAGGVLVITEYARAFASYRTAQGTSLILDAAAREGFTVQKSLPIFRTHAVWVLKRP